MVEISSVESIEHNSVDTVNLNNQRFKLNKTNEIEEKELLIKRFSKYIASFDYFDVFNCFINNKW